MKSLKFIPSLATMILQGDKTITWRLFDDKDLKVSDKLTFINKATLEPFGTAVITSLHTKTLGTLSSEDWVGHEKFPSDEAMYANYRNFYGDKVNKDTEVKIIAFKFEPLK